MGGTSTHWRSQRPSSQSHSQGACCLFFCIFVVELRRRVLTMMMVNCAINPPTSASARQHQLGQRSREEQHPRQ